MDKKNPKILLHRKKVSVDMNACKNVVMNLVLIALSRICLIIFAVPPDVETEPRTGSLLRAAPPPCSFVYSPARFSSGRGMAARSSFN